MLLSFQIKNYKSFKNETTFSMVPAPKQKGLDYSIQSKTIAGKTYKALSSAVIYGPNASGKTNLIGAMDTMKEIILRGNIRNANDGTLNYAAAMLELIPFRSQSDVPTMFSIAFVENGLLVEYTLSINLGTFMDRSYSRYIVDEILTVNNNVVFKRSDVHTSVTDQDENNEATANRLTVDISKINSKYLNPKIRSNMDSAVEIAKNGLNPDELFLTNGFKNIFAKNLVSLILNWFEQKLTVIYRADALRTIREIADPQKFYVERTLTEAAKEFGIHSNALGYVSVKDSDNPVLSSIIDDGETKAVLPAEIYESYGTVRFVNEFPLIIGTLLNGGTLIMDEFDASIHPMALMNIINIFHNDDINIHHAQLIFNTHNPIFLNANLFRRDEIKFVERDDQTHESEHYSLSDFKTSGEHGVRKGEDYMKNYFVSQYGAIKDVDFSSILESIMHEEGTDHGS